MRLVLATYNIRAGGVGRGRQIVEVLARSAPDVVILQEAIYPDVVESIGEGLGLTTVIARRSHSVAALSRFPVRAFDYRLAPTGRDVLELRFEKPALRLFGVHFAAGLSQRGERRRIVEVTHLLELTKGAAGDAPVALLGDFNAVAPGDAPFVRRMPLWIRALLRFDGGIRTDAMAAVAGAGFTDAYRAANAGFAGLTLPSGAPVIRLDYLMLDESLAGRLVACRTGEPGPVAALASDHLPVIAELDLDGEPDGS
jgi:endonuclease/exonuclease/phosphatase family metal-dependent hydrolase